MGVCVWGACKYYVKLCKGCTPAVSVAFLWAFCGHVVVSRGSPCRLLTLGLDLPRIADCGDPSATLPMSLRTTLPISLRTNVDSRVSDKWTNGHMSMDMGQMDKCPWIFDKGHHV